MKPIAFIVLAYEASIGTLLVALGHSQGNLFLTGLGELFLGFAVLFVLAFLCEQLVRRYMRHPREEDE